MCTNPRWHAGICSENALAPLLLEWDMCASHSCRALRSLVYSVACHAAILHFPVSQGVLGSLTRGHSLDPMGLACAVSLDETVSKFQMGFDFNHSG